MRVQAGLRAPAGKRLYQTLPLCTPQTLLERTATRTLADLAALISAPLTRGDALWVQDRRVSGFPQTPDGGTL